MRIEKIIADYLCELKSVKRYSVNTIKAYKEDLLGFLNFCAENKKTNINEVTNRLIKHFLMDMNEKGLDKRSVARKLASLRGMFKYAFQRDLIPSNPALNISNPKLNKKLPEVIQLDSIIKIYSLADEIEENPLIVKIIFELLYGCALRVSELCNIKLLDIDVENKTLKVKGKGNKHRIVPIGSKSIQIVNDYLNWRNKLNSSDFFLLNEKGEGIYPRYVYRVVNRYLSKVTDVKKKSPHVLRHTAATHMLDRGADLRAVKEILGHENLSTTQIYTHVSIEKLKSTYKKAHPKS